MFFRWVLISLLIAPVSGNDTEEKEQHLYVTATVRERPVSSATASVTLLDHEQIEAIGARSTADLLRFIPGMEIATDGFRGGFTTAQIRGGDPNFTLVLLDGIPLNDPTSQAGDAFNLSGLPTTAIERIEVVRGPLSAFYGSSGLAGAINIITVKDTGESLKPHLLLEGGDPSLTRASAGVSGRSGAMSYDTGISFEEEDEDLTNEPFEALNLHGNLGFSLPGESLLRLNMRYADWQGDDFPDASGGILGTGELRHSENRETSLGISLALGGSRRHKISLNTYRHELDRISPGVLPLVPPSVEDTTYTRMRLGWNATLIERDHLQLFAGLDFDREKGENSSILSFDFGDIPGDYDLTRETSGAYLEMLIHQGDLLFELGSRIDVTDDNDTEWSPRLGVSYQMDRFRVRSSAGRAFKLASFFALASPRALGGNPDLEPETSVGGDVGVEYAHESLETGVTLFYNRFEDLVDFDFDIFQNINRSEVEAKGSEFFVRWSSDATFSVDLNATWQQVEDPNSDQPVKHRPKWVGGARIQWRPLQKLSLLFDARSVSRSFDVQLTVPGRNVTSGFTLYGMSASWAFSDQWKLRLRGDNLTDKSYEALIGHPGAGRSVRLAVRYGR